MEITYEEMKQIIPGTIARGKEIGNKDQYSKFIWTVCEQCTKGRWLRLDKSKPKLCRSCTSHNVYTQICTPHPPNWKGGRRLCHGYILVIARGHPRADKAGYVQEHILIWEQIHNKHLPKGWAVHHLNGIKIDNRPENLVAYPSRKHQYVLAAKSQRIRELEAKVKILERALRDKQLIYWEITGDMTYEGLKEITRGNLCAQCGRDLTIKTELGALKICCPHDPQHHGYVERTTWIRLADKLPGFRYSLN